MTNTTQEIVNFPKLMSRLLSLLTDKEQNIVERRFSLNGKKKETLEKIGQSYSITRERVRQIEAVAIKKLARISMDPEMKAIHEMAYGIIVENGGVCGEEILISEMIKRMPSSEKIDPNAMKLAVRVSDRVIKQEKNQTFKPFWRTQNISMAEIRESIKALKKALKPQSDFIDEDTLIEKVSNKTNNSLSRSVLHIDWEFMNKGSQWGLTTCRLINPKSIKDKIMIVLRNEGKPLHFSEIIKQVSDSFKGNKTVTPQAIHNELIRHDDFTLVGRGLYGLQQWGIPSGTVCDIIRDVLVENKGPMKRQEIIEKVLEKRDIRIGTISLNLQKYDFFQRVGRAVYEYNASMDKRRRNLKALGKNK